MSNKKRPSPKDMREAWRLLGSVGIKNTYVLTKNNRTLKSLSYTMHDKYLKKFGMYQVLCMFNDAHQLGFGVILTVDQDNDGSLFIVEAQAVTEHDQMIILNDIEDGKIYTINDLITIATQQDRNKSKGKR